MNHSDIVLKKKLLECKMLRSFAFLLCVACTHAGSRPCGRDSDGQARLVIVSHARYGEPLRVLMNSLENNGFSEFCRTVVVASGEREERGPERAGNVTTIRTALDSYEYSGMAALREHAAHPLVSAPAFFYMPVTSVAAPEFADFFDRLVRELGEADVLASPSEMDSNVIAFSPALLERCGDRFRRRMSNKKDAMYAEATRLMRCGTPPERTRLTRSPRVLLGEADPYSTDAPRLVYHYPDFGMYKFVCESVTGCAV